MILDAPHPSPAPLPLSPLGLLPGLAAAGAVAAAAFTLQRLPLASAVNPAILALLLGITLRGLWGRNDGWTPGLAAGTKSLLRGAVVLLGLQVTAGQILGLGFAGLSAILLSLAACFLFTLWLGARLGVAPALTHLIAAGTSICGASAIAAANSAVRGSEDDVAYAMATVTIFGTLAVVAMPAAAAWLDLPPYLYGLWTGISIHEVAQVAAAAFQRGAESGNAGIVAKLARVVCLAPVTLILMTALSARHADAGPRRAPLPLFVAGFLLVAAVNSLGVIAPALADAGIALSRVLLAMALAALGLQTDLGRLRARGLRPLLLAAAAWLVLSGVSLLLIRFFV